MSDISILKGWKNYISAYLIEQGTGNRADVLPMVQVSPLILENREGDWEGVVVIENKRKNGRN